MASGSTLTVTGGTNMVQVVAGDTIGPADYDNMVANVYRQLGTPNDVTLGTYSSSSTYGYNQSTGSLNAATGEAINASSTDNGYKNLQDEVQTLATFLGHSLNSSSSSDSSAGDSITATDWSNLMDDVKDVFDARHSIPGSSLTTDAAVTSTRTTGWGSSSEPAILHQFTLTFANEAACRGFFNSGGEVLFTASRSGGTSGSSAGTIGSQNSNWTSLLSAMGTLRFNLDDLVSSGSTGTSANKGFYELTTNNQQLYIKYGSGAYASNYYKIEGSVNSTTNPTVLTFNVTMRDDHALGDGIGPDGIDGNSDDSDGYVDAVDGTIQSVIQTNRANNGIVHVAPSSATTSNL
tara:strand:+ start:2512 stop:3558 length:1047 start_codon:yes stop_codon:yes gene_type:complete